MARNLCTNAQRADNGRITIEGRKPMSGSDEETLIDILTDLQHWAKEEGVDFFACYHVAASHFQSEAG